MMKAVQLRAPGGGPEVVRIPRPQPGPEGLLIAVEAAGLCKSDLLLFDMAPALVRHRFPLPMTLGHEVVGTVAGHGDAVTGVAVGDRVAVYGARGCDACVACAQDRENYCPHTTRLRIRPPGLGAPGGMAEFLAVDSARQLVPAGGLDATQAAPLTDAGVTAYHAVGRSAGRLISTPPPRLHPHLRRPNHHARQAGRQLLDA